MAADMIAKLNRILDGLMGVKLDLGFTAVGELSIDQWNPIELAHVHKTINDGPQYIEDDTGTAFGFPVNLRGEFAGLAIVKGWDGARPRQLVLLAELITSVMENGLKQDERRDQLRQIEERVLLNENTPANVIALRPSRFGKVLQITETQLTSTPEVSPLTRLPLLIETKADFPLHRIAVEIHQLSNRWALVNLSDLPADVLDSVEGLKQLGAISLFIKDLEALSTEQQLRLAEYLASGPGSDMPQVIAGLVEITDERERRILPHLLDQFCHSELSWSERTPEEITRTFIQASLEILIEKAHERLTHGKYYMPFNVRQLDPNSPTWN